jgi:hypothetical protein
MDKRGATSVSATLRWGLLLGAVAAALGVGGQALGFATLPSASSATIDNAVGALVIAGLLGLVAFFMALGLAYVAGIRVERERPRAAPSAEAALLDPAAANRGPGLAGLLVMALYGIATTIFGVVGGPHTTGPSDSSSFLATHVVLALVYLAFGFGLGALGGRAPAARRLLDDIAKAPPAPLPSVPPPDAISARAEPDPTS